MVLALGAAVVAQRAAPTTRPADASEAWFARRTVARLRIEVAADQLELLKAAPREFVHATVREEGGATLGDVGLKLKGAAGSFREWDDKPALTVRADKWQRGQRFHDLCKFHLNNSVQDESFLSEAVCAELFQRAGVPTPRVQHARVWLNGRDVGIYVVKEGFDQGFLRRWFADASGNLYDGGFCQDVDAELEKDAGADPDARDDLHALRAACQATDLAQAWMAVERLVDVEALITFMAVELMAAHWDGYTAKANNYRLYFDPQRQRAYFLPHGMDQAFGELDLPILDAPNGMVAALVMKRPEWRARFRRRIDELLPLFDVVRIHQRIDAIAARLRTALQGEAGAEHQERVREFKERVAGRVARLRVQRAAPEPRPLSFERSATVGLQGWRPVSESEDARVETVVLGGSKSLHIAVGPSGACKASFRTNALLARGRYRFSGMLRTKDLAGAEAGATLRISGAARARVVTGSSEWQAFDFEFEVGEAMRDVQLVAELRGARGQAWFRMDSLKLTRVAP